MRIRARTFAALVSVAALAAPLAGEGQQVKGSPRIGFLASSSGERLKSRVEAFENGLRALGYAPGQSIVIDYRSAGGKFERLPELAAELIRLKIDVLVAEGAPAAHAAKNATRVIPIVMGNAADPVGTGLVVSLARPGGNVTGLSDFNLAVVTKRLELLKEVVPSVSRVAVLLNPANPTNPPQLKEIRAAAPALGLSLLPLESKGAEEIDPAFAAMKAERVGAVLVLGDPMFGTHARRIADLAAGSRLPAIYGNNEAVDAGGLMSFGANFADLYRRAAIYVDKILKGARPADLPVEQPVQFELVVSLNAAKRIGLTIPPAILSRADRVLP